MKYEDIRKMNDKELNHFLLNIQRDNKRVCSKCKEFILNKIVVNAKKIKRQEHYVLYVKIVIQIC